MRFHADLRDISSNARLKTYPDGSFELMASDKPIFRESGWESAERRTCERCDSERSGSDSERSEHSGSDSDSERSERSESDLERAARRARTRVRDLARSNPFTQFVTFTLDPAKIDRYDMAVITRKLNQWLDNRVRRDGLQYILVPERHKDGAIHFHGLINDALRGTSSGTFSAAGWAKPRRPRSAAERREWAAQPDTYHRVYNLPAWTLGFSTAIRLYGDRAASIEYVCKYIGKQGEKPGGRWYYSGGALREPTITYPDFGYRDVAEMPGAYTFRVDAAGAAFAIVRG